MLCTWNLSNCQVTVSIFKLVFLTACICIVHSYNCVNHLHFSLVQILFSFVFGMVMYDNKFKANDNKIWTEDNTEPQLKQ